MSSAGTAHLSPQQLDNQGPASQDCVQLGRLRRGPRPADIRGRASGQQLLHLDKQAIQPRHNGGYPCGGESEPCGSDNKPYFRTNNNATRGQISKIVSNAAGYNDPAGTQIFEDVQPGSSFYDWVQRLATRGIMGGYNCGGASEPCGSDYKPYFRPNNNATRGQVSKIVANTFFPTCEASNPTK